MSYYSKTIYVLNKSFLKYKPPFHIEIFISSGFLLTISLVSQDFQDQAETKEVPFCPGLR